MRYDGNKNHWRKYKDNWAASISEVQCDFILKSDNIPPDNSNPYVCNTSNLADGYILKILDLNIPTSDSDQCRNTLEHFCAMSRWWGGWVVERADGRCDFSLVLLSCLQKMEIWRVEQGCERKSSQSGWRGVPSHKHTRLHNNFKIEDLIIKRKVCSLRNIVRLMVWATSGRHD